MNVGHASVFIYVTSGQSESGQRRPSWGEADNCIGFTAQINIDASTSMTTEGTLQEASDNLSSPGSRIFVFERLMGGEERMMWWLGCRIETM